MSRQPWLTSEPGVLAGLRRAAQLCRGGLRRPFLTSFLACGAAVAVAVFVLFGRRNYAPEFVLRVVEGQTRSRNAPPLKRQLAEYVRQAIFTSEPLTELMRKHHLYPSLLQRNTRAALESFKEDISVEVYQNYFVENRAPGDQPRSARLTVSFHAKDPALALAVTRDLGALIEAHEHASRGVQANSAAFRAARARDTWVSAWQRRTADISAKRAEIAARSASDPRLQVELVGLLGSMPALEREVDAAERRAASLELGAAWERHGIGLNFEVVDDGSLPGRAARARNATWAGVATLLCGLPLVALAVGAFRPSKEGQA
jgi:hypothetical protein